MNDITVIAHTGHKEKPEFENKVMEHLVSVIGDIPLIVVSHKSFPWGNNICLGDIGVSGENAVRQFYIGALAARTKYVCRVETDTLYPRDYFEFVPPRDDTFYLPDPMWIAWALRGKQHSYQMKRGGSEGTIIANRELVLKSLNSYFGTEPEKRQGNGMFWTYRVEKFATKCPILGFKTDGNLHRATPVDKTTDTKELEPYGNIYTLMSNFNL